jgi:hypothetical protein
MVGKSSTLGKQCGKLTTLPIALLEMRSKVFSCHQTLPYLIQFWSFMRNFHGHECAILETKE